MKRLFLSLLAAFFLISSANTTAHAENSSGKSAPDSVKSKSFEPGPFIIDHIIDSYGWHIAGDGDTSVTIPLPVILVEHWKPTFFMSSRFHHGHNAYQGYAMGFTEETENKIVKLSGEYANYTGELSEIFEKEGICEGNREKAATLIDTDATKAIYDISITKNVCSLLISIIILIWLFLAVAKQYKKREGMAPRGAQGLVEPVILFIRDEVAIPSLGSKYEKYLPYLLTLFFFILVNNLMGLIPIFPGGANVTGNIAVTGVLALITFFITSFSADKHYWKHLVNTPGVPWWLKFPIPLMPAVEIIGIFTKPFVLMVRLFANITAGHIIALGFMSLIFIFGESFSAAAGYGISIVSVFFYIFMGLLELIVAFIQAFVFTLLTAMFTGMAMGGEHEEAHE